MNRPIDGGSREVAAMVLADENLLYKVLECVDVHEWVNAECVCKQWRQLVRAEFLSDEIYMRHLAKIGFVDQPLRSGILALGGLRRLYCLYLWPLFKAEWFGSCVPDFYYKILQTNPESVRRVYTGASTIVRVDGKRMQTATTMQQIDTLVKFIGYSGIEIKTRHSLESSNLGTLVMISAPCAWLHWW